MLDRKTMLKIARAAQTRAALLAPYQNTLDVRLAPKTLLQRVLWFLRPPKPADLSAKAVEGIVNDLLNAGNVLEQVVLSLEPEETPDGRDPAGVSAPPPARRVG